MRKKQRINALNTDTLGKRICYIQKLSGKTQDEFLQQLGIAKSTLNNYMYDRRKPDSRFLALLCEQYNINSAWLLLNKGLVSNDLQIKNADVRPLPNYYPKFIRGMLVGWALSTGFWVFLYLLIREMWG